MVGVSQRLRDRARGKQESSEDVYRKLVFASARTGKCDVAELGDASEALGLDADAFDKDEAAVKYHDGLSQTLKPLLGREAELAKLADVGAELDELNAKRMKLIERRGEAQAALTTLASARGEQRRLENQNPRLWPTK